MCELPSFNFKSGKREYKVNIKQLGKDDILVIEGIYGLMRRLPMHFLEVFISRYISAPRTNINIDEHNRIQLRTQADCCVV